jgi:hypothetical protein
MGFSPIGLGRKLTHNYLHMTLEFAAFPSGRFGVRRSHCGAGLSGVQEAFKAGVVISNHYKHVPPVLAVVADAECIMRLPSGGQAA